MSGARTPKLRWWRELLYILAFYSVYTLIRNTQGSASVSAAKAFANARRIVDKAVIASLLDSNTSVGQPASVASSATARSDGSAAQRILRQVFGK